MKMIVVSELPEGRVELALSFPDEYGAALPVGQADARLRFALQATLDQTATILQVAGQDRKNAGLVHGEPRSPMVPAPAPASDAGLHQVAFAGSEEAVEVDGTGAEVRRTRAGEPVEGGR